MILITENFNKSRKTGENTNSTSDRDNLGRFAPGSTVGKLGGRPKGVKDKINLLREQLLDYFINYGTATLLEEVRKENKSNVLAALSKMLPKITELDDVTEDKKPIVIIDATDI